MANHYSGKRVAGRKPVGKRALSLLMALVMSLSLVQITAFAVDGGLTDEQAAKKAAQIVYAGGETEGLDTTRVTMSKTAEVTDTEGKFLVTLNVTTKDKIETVTETKEPSIDVVVLVDNSWSMSQDGRTRLTDAKDAATAFVDKFLKETYTNRRVAVYTFGDSVYEASGLTKDATALKNKIDKIDWKYEGTNMQIALKKARDVLSTSGADYKYVNSAL